ncbi:hypothetical protein Cgig2_026703 [Carnegiea gigantea]|uniref:Uncharacterized protein n=1 Tax=Carnegiea gigantea TaxID=171969 RepID=A0A9Q1Q570_9CARY|nr:hypothetical protein Cgig2_026703 [Carnegiea gigantea]
MQITLTTLRLLQIEPSLLLRLLRPSLHRKPYLFDSRTPTETPWAAPRNLGGGRRPTNSQEVATPSARLMTKAFHRTEEDNNLSKKLLLVVLASGGTVGVEVGARSDGDKEKGGVSSFPLPERKKALDAEEASKDDLLGLLLKSSFQGIQDDQHESNKRQQKNVKLSLKEVVEECELFYLAGQDTTLSLLLW